MPTKDHDIKLGDGSSTRRFRLLQQNGRKSWSVKELPPEPNIDSPAAAREGLPPSRLLPFDGQDWSWGAGLTRPTPQTQRPGHVLRYADGFNIDTSEVGKVKHGPLVSAVGTLSADPIGAKVFIDEVWFLTNEHLYSFAPAGPTLTLEWTNPDGALNLEMEVLGSNLFIAASNTKIWHTTGIGSPITVTSTAFAATHLLQIGNQLWRSFSGDQISSSINPAAGSPTWSAGASAGDTGTIQNLFSISGLLGVATLSSLYIVTVDADANITSTELNKSLRVRRGGSVFSVKAESGTDVWFSDGFHQIIRLIAEGFEVFDLRPAGPFRGTDERPVTEPDVTNITIGGISQDVDAIYVAASRVSDAFIYKGVEIARGVYSWSPIHKLSPQTTDLTFLAVLGTSGDLFPVVYFNDGADVKQFDTVWTAYASDWELETSKFSATLPQWDKMWNRIRAFLNLEANTKMTVSRRVDSTVAYSVFGSTGEMTSDGDNELSVTTPIAGKEIQLKFAGNTTSSGSRVDLFSFLLEGFLRVDDRPIYDFTVIADNKADGTFINSLRDLTSKFVTLTDRFGDAHTVAILPGFPEEIEVIDEATRAPVMAFHIVAQRVT